MVKLEFSHIVGISIFGLLVVIGVIRHELALEPALERELVSTIIGSGILALFVAGLFYYFDKKSDERNLEREAESFLRGQLAYDLREVEDRPMDWWLLGSSNRFYFGNSKLNYYYDVLKVHAKEIQRHRDVLGSNRLWTVCVQLYAGIRKALTLAENVDRVFYAAVIEVHKKHHEPSHTDADAVEYVRAKVFTEMKDEEIIRGIARFGSVPTHLQELVIDLGKNEQMNRALKALRDRRKTLEALSEELARLANEY